MGDFSVNNQFFFGSSEGKGEGSGFLGEFPDVDKTFTSTGGSPIARLGNRMEGAVRPFVQIESRLPEPAREKSPLPGEGSEAFISWGGPASLTFTPLVKPAEDVNADKYGTQTGATTTNGQKAQPQKQSPQDKRPHIVTLKEMDRKEETITVYKPGDNTIWMNVNRVLAMRMRAVEGPKEHVGLIYKMQFKPPPPPGRPRDQE